MVGGKFGRARNRKKRTKEDIDVALIQEEVMVHDYKFSKTGDEKSGVEKEDEKIGKGEKLKKKSHIQGRELERYPEKVMMLNIRGMYKECCDEKEARGRYIGKEDMQRIYSRGDSEEIWQRKTKMENIILLNLNNVLGV